MVISGILVPELSWPAGGHSGEVEIPLFQPCFLLVSGILEVQVLINLFPGWGGKGLVARQESLQCPGRGCESSKPGREACLIIS